MTMWQRQNPCAIYAHLPRTFAEKGQLKNHIQKTPQNAFLEEQLWFPDVVCQLPQAKKKQAHVKNLAEFLGFQQAR